MIQQQEIFIGMARIVAGPPLPPEMIWKRSFQNLMFDFSVKEVPRSIFFKPMGTIIYSKRTWSIAFDESKQMSCLHASLPLVVADRRSVVVKRLVARALFENLPADSTSASEDVAPAIAASSVSAESTPVSASADSTPMVFSVEQTVRKQREKKKPPVVDTSLRRCTRSAAKLDGFKNVVFEQLSLQPSKKRPRAKPMEDKAQPTSADGAEDASTAAPPHTPIRVLQAVGAELEIAPSLLSVDKLMANRQEDLSASSA